MSPDSPHIPATRAQARAARAVLRRGIGAVAGVGRISVRRCEDGGYGVLVTVRDASLADHVPDRVASAPVGVRVRER